MESYFFSYYHIIVSIFFIQKYFEATIVIYPIRFSQEWEKMGVRKFLGLIFWQDGAPSNIAYAVNGSSGFLFGSYPDH